VELGVAELIQIGFVGNVLAASSSQAVTATGTKFQTLAQGHLASCEPTIAPHRHLMAAHRVMK
jgi:hypothetical protein